MGLGRQVEGETGQVVGNHRERQVEVLRQLGPTM